MSLRYNGKNIHIARMLRENATPEERHLWYDFLRNYKVRFQRQKAIGDYVVDFYCHKARLVIEIDGTQHFLESGAEKDKERTNFLESNGLTVIRFSNNEIKENFKGVCERIDMVVNASLGEGGGTAKL